MSSTAINQTDHFTYGDFQTWPDDERWELIDGIAYNMTPAPSTLHQRISRVIFLQVAAALKATGCEAFYAPFDVRLPEHGEADDFIKTVVQPDIAVVCDPGKIDEAGCRGAPDFIIEIVSPSTAKRDQVDKVALYERFGVREYWIIHPADGVLTIRGFGDSGQYSDVRALELKGRVTVQALAGLEIDLDAVDELRAQAHPETEKKPSPSVTI